MERKILSEIPLAVGDRSGGRIHTFDHIQGQKGFFVGGNSPVWVMVSAASAYPFVHPMRYWQANSIDIDTTSTADPTDLPTSEELSDLSTPKQTMLRAVIGFTPLSIRDSAHGFAFIDQDHRLHIAQLPALPNYHFAWPLLRIPFGRAVHQVVYHPVMRSYCVVTSVSETFRMTSDDIDSDPEAEAVNIRKELPPEILMNIAKSNATEDPSQPEDPTPRVEPTVPRFALEVVSPVTWEVVDRFDFPINEHVSALKCVSLRSKETVTGRKFKLAVGTTRLLGEDKAVKGSLYLFEIIEVVPEPGKPETFRKLKQVYHDTVKGAVSTVCGVNGFLLLTNGPKTYIHNHNDGEDNVIAFLDMAMYVTCSASLKNFILLGDVTKGATFAGFQDDPAKLIELGKDYQPMSVSCGEFIVDDRSTYMVVADDECNLHLLSFSPGHIHSFSGRKLLRRADFHVGSQVLCLQRLPARTVLLRNNSSSVPTTRTNPLPPPQSTQKQLCVGVTDNGMLFAVSSVPEIAFKRLQRLYLQLVNTVPHVAGLNPRAYRLLPANQRLDRNPAKGVLDATLIRNYLDQLPLARRRELIHQIGTTLERVIMDLGTLSSEIDYF
ncbi:mRNA cleavage and polyadenylation factor subunit [Dispira simplex]|nr:mRNA cleavage and polyadenylation factor subunit [Dispira simplex]